MLHAPSNSLKLKNFREYDSLISMKIPRFHQGLTHYLRPNKVLVIYGPRQVGKTTLVRDFLATYPDRYKLDSGENIRLQTLLSSQDFDAIKEYVQGYSLIVIDEAQKVPQIGQALKILVDQVPGIQVIATGSSSFDLAGQVGEPLTGRKITLTLYPIAQIELQRLYNPYELKNKLAEWLIIIRKLRWRRSQKVVVTLRGERVTIQDWKRKKERLKVIGGRGFL